MKRLAAVCLLVGVGLGAFGGYKVFSEHKEVLRLRAMQAIHQGLKDDAEHIGQESQSSIGAELALGVASTAQTLIDSVQEDIDLHRQEEKVGWCLLAVGGIFLCGGVLLWRKTVPRKTAEPPASSAVEPPPSAIESSAPAVASIAPAVETIASEAEPPFSEGNSEISPVEGATATGPWRPDYWVLAAGGILIVLILIAISMSPAKSSPAAQSQAASSSPQTQSPPAAVPETPVSSWNVETEANPVTGVVTTTLSLKYQGAQNIILRQIGKKLDCYISTDTFLETLDNMDSRVSSVQYKFDDGKVIRQGWTISDDNTALFYPGNCASFIAQLRKAKALAFEYHPADKIAQTLTFDVDGFPDAFQVDAPVPAHTHAAGADSDSAQDGKAPVAPNN